MFNAIKRLPRVKIEYQIEVYGAEKYVQLPHVMGVMADLSGSPAEPLPSVSDRKFLEFDSENFNERLRSLKPRLAIKVHNTLTGEGQLYVDISFESIDDFHPAEIAKAVEPLKKLLEIRVALNNLLPYLEGREEIQKYFEDITGYEDLICLVDRLERLGVNESGEAVELEDDVKLNPSIDNPRVQEFFDILDHFSFTERARETITRAIYFLASLWLEDSGCWQGHLLPTVEHLILNFDKRLSEQVNQIIHHEDFQALESVWRGLHYLVENSETDKMLKIRVFNISKKGLWKSLRSFKGSAWNQSPIFKKINEEEYGIFGGEPYICIVGDFYFNHSPEDIECLSEMAGICAASGATFITGASPNLFQMDSWSEINHPRALEKIFTTPEYASWGSLRNEEHSGYIYLTMPRFLARLPFEAETNLIKEFNFEEDILLGTRERFCWTNSAYAMAVNINRAFKLYGWYARICGVETGGAIEYPPMHCFHTEEGGLDTVGPTEVDISDRRGLELAACGIMSLQHRSHTNTATFNYVPSLRNPPLYDDPYATDNARLEENLQYRLCINRFALFLKCIVRDKIGSFKDRVDMENFLNEWINNYVEPDPMALELMKARKPLESGGITVEEIEGEPGYYTTKIYLRPRYQLESLPFSLKLTTTLPSARF